MSLEFGFRLIGMIVFAAVGASFGGQIADDINLPNEASSLLFLLVGALTGLIMTPWITTRPAKAARDRIVDTSAETLATSMIGLLFGLILSALLAWPLSL
ncbi:MAG: PIN domain nuclease, partial [Chloroflexi bacterium]|nr:PIN domain nuclease [Chloroflexota bacterium]